MGEKVNDTLQERGNRYGKFKSHAQITQLLKSCMVLSNKWEDLEPDQKEALEMIMHKVGRILNGDPNYAENYRDIAGYATLVMIRLLESDGTTDSKVLPIKRINGEWINEKTGDKVEVSA